MFTQKSIPLLIFLWLLLVGGINYFAKPLGCCGGLASIPSLLINDGATTVGSAANNFHFGLGGAAPIAIDGVKGEMQKVADYLSANPGKNLTLTGLYKADETNGSDAENLGLGRAAAVKAYLVGLGAPAAQLLTGGRGYSDLSVIDDKAYNAIDWAFSARPTGISFIDGTSFNRNYEDDFAFAKSGYEHVTPLSEGLTTTIGQTAEYLKKGGRTMVITGYYTDGEENTGALNDLGLARANNIKKVFTDLGVPSKQLDIASEKRTITFGDDATKGLATFVFSGAKSNDRLAEVEARLRANPLVLYFQTNKSNLSLSSAQRQYLTDLVYYLDNKEGGTVNSTGHTDNKGSRAVNTRLGRKRAEFVKDYLKRNNISESKIKVGSKGPDAPTATNDTEEGRAKNRRVEITIN